MDSACPVKVAWIENSANRVHNILNIYILMLIMITFVKLAFVNRLSGGPCALSELLLSDRHRLYR